MSLSQRASCDVVHSEIRNRATGRTLSAACLHSPNLAITVSIWRPSPPWPEVPASTRCLDKTLRPKGIPGPKIYLSDYLQQRTGSYCAKRFPTLGSGPWKSVQDVRVLALPDRVIRVDSRMSAPGPLCPC